MANNQVSKKPDAVTSPNGKPVFSWEAPEFIRYKKTTRWFLLLSVVAIALIVIFYFQKQWSSIAVVAVALVVFMTISNAKPKKVSCALYREGIVVAEKVYGFNQFKSFWVEPGDLFKIKLQLLGRFSGQVTMPILEVDPEQIRLFLGKHLPEEENRGPDLVDEINKLLRF